jgi:hypothetical protein
VRKINKFVMKLGMNRKQFVIFISLLFLCGTGINCSIRTSFKRCFRTEGKTGNDIESLETILELSREDFDQVILPYLHNLCKRCHRKYFDEYEKVLSLVSVGDPTKSQLYQRAKGEDGHPEVWPPGSHELVDLGRWILGEPLVETP